MKTKLLLLVLTILSLTSYAGSNCGLSDFKLIIKDHGFYTVSLDGQYLTSSQHAFYFDRIRPGMHRLVVMKNYGRKHCRFGRNMEVMYDGLVQILPESSMMAYFDRFAGFEIVAQVEDCHNIFHEEIHPICGMSQFQFEDFCNSISRRNFESTRVELAKTAIQQNNFTTDQIKVLLSYFTFESSKLEVAKLAYAKTIDRQNYFRI